MKKKILAALTAAAIPFTLAPPAQAAASYTCSGWHYADTVDRYVSVQSCAQVRRRADGYEEGRAVLNMRVVAGSVSRGLHVNFIALTTTFPGQACTTATVFWGNFDTTWTVPGDGRTYVVNGAWTRLRQVNKPATHCDGRYVKHGAVYSSANTWRRDAGTTDVYIRSSTLGF